MWEQREMLVRLAHGRVCRKIFQGYGDRATGVYPSFGGYFGA
jgi:hypothetical protein